MRRPDAESTTPPDRSFRWLALILFSAVLAVYFSSLSGGFLWDDDGHVTRSELRSVDGLVRIWTEPGATQQYYPLLHSAFWFEHLLWGDSPFGYRLINLLLHATSACFFAAILRRLAVPGAWLAAFLFALHPVCVESVAWISEQKNTLSLVFYLGAALAYLRFDTDRRPGFYLIATALFVAALLAKTVTATLPAALLVILTWKQGRLDFRRTLAPLSIWFAFALAAGLTTAWAERTLIGAKGENFSLSLVERCLLAGRIIWFYAGKLFWPADLIFIYPRWTIDAGVFWQWLFPVSTVALTGLLIWFKKYRPPLVTWLLFCGTLFPALGFFNVYPFLFSYVADHFQYHASLAVFALVAAALTQFSTNLDKRARLIGATILVLLLGILSAQQSLQYRSARTLYETTLARNPSCWLAHNNLAQVLTDESRPDLATEHLRHALELRPKFPAAENNLGYALIQLRRHREAIPHFEQAIALQTNYAEAYNNLGLAHINLGEPEPAIAAFRQATRLSRNYPLAHFNLGLALAQSGRTAEAIPEFSRAVALKPDYADAELNWAIGLMLSQRFPEAVPHFERAVQLDPESANTHFIYARALLQNGQIENGITHYRTVLDLDPENINAHANLAAALQQRGELREAEFHLSEAKRLQAARNFLTKP